MTNKRILVTGGAGYIGSHTVIELIAAGYEPVILDNLSNSDRKILKNINKLAGYQVPFVFGDCADPVIVGKVYKKYGPFKGIVHFAALKAVQESIHQPLRYYRNNLDGLMSLLEAAGQHGTGAFVFSSSCTVYGQPDKLPVRETTPLKDAECPYGDTKEMAERILHAVVRGGAALRIVALRYFNPIGAHASGLIGELPIGAPKNLVPLVTQAAAGNRGQLTVYGDDYNTPDGTCIRDYIHVVDLAKAHVRALAYLQKQKEPSFYDIFNVGTGRGVSVMELLRTFEKETGVKVPYKVGPRRAGDIEKIYASVDKATKVLGWKAELTVKDALKSAWAWETGYCA
ncbi:MAG: UDP-glucose 4-epimerase GalE [Candidatus Omnitrophota bacterium]